MQFQKIYLLVLRVTDRIRRNCSDNIINNITYKKRLIEYNAYFMKSRYMKKKYIRPFLRQQQYLEEKH